MSKGSPDFQAHRRYALVLAFCLGIVAVVCGLNPHDRSAWALENALVLLLIICMAVFHRKLVLSRISYTCLFVFLCLHEIGSHYTYSLVPYDAWFQSLTGRTLNSIFGWERNHYDRLIHFTYGLLLAYPIREIFLRVANVRGFWGYFLPLDLTMSTSMLYELIEWGAAIAFGGELGAAYLGTQGDVWDAHKDMALASLGAIIAMTITAAINARLQRDFADEFVQSLKVHGAEPLGEDAIIRMRGGK